MSQISPGRKNSLQYEIDGSARPRRGTRRSPTSSGSAIATSRTRSCIRNPALMGAGRPRGRRTARWPRRGLRGHVPRAVPGDLRRCRATGASRRAPAYADLRGRARRDARRRCRSQRAPASGGWVEVDRSSRPSRQAEVAAMKLGLLTAPFPETPLCEVADWAAGERGSRASRSPAGPWPRARRVATPAPPTSTSPSSPTGRAQRDPAPRSTRTACRSPGSATTRTRCIQIPAAARPAIAPHASSVIEAAASMDVPFFEHVHGRRRVEARRTPNWETALRGLAGDRRRIANDTRREDHASRTAR